MIATAPGWSGPGPTPAGARPRGGHLDSGSRRAEVGARLGSAPPSFHKPVSALNAHGGDVVPPPRCRFLNYEGEIAIVIGSQTRHIAPDEAGERILGFTIA